jgi:hypothetical protein
MGSSGGLQLPCHCAGIPEEMRAQNRYWGSHPVLVLTLSAKNSRDCVGRSSFREWSWAVDPSLMSAQSTVVQDRFWIGKKFRDNFGKRWQTSF